MLENVRGFYNGYLLDQGNLWEYCWLVVSPWHRTPSCPCPNLFPSLFFLISQALKPKIYTILQNILISGLATTFLWLYFWLYLYEVQIHYSVGTTCWLDCSHFCSWQRRLWVPDRSPSRRWQKRDPGCYQVRRMPSAFSLHKSWPLALLQCHSCPVGEQWLSKRKFQALVLALVQW